MERKKDWLVRLQVSLAMLLSVVSGFASSDSERLKHLERSFSVHASLAPLPENGNWNTNFASLEAPAEAQIHNAARLLTQDYNANRLYLLYQKEIPLVDAERVFQTWREACPSEIEIVPALMLNGGTTNQSELFSPLEIRRLSEFFKQQVNPKHIAVLCSSQMRSHELALKILSANFGTGLVRLDLQPDETAKAPFGGAIAQTASALCSAESNEKWQQDISGLERLHKWIEARNGQSTPIAWSLAVVGCDHSKSQGDAVLGHNDAERNAPIASGRNGIVVSEVLQHAKPGSFTGFNTDLHAMQLSSQAVSHDGSGYSFYEMLKRGQLYVGYYARPFLEIVNAYGSLRSGKTAPNNQ